MANPDFQQDRAASDLSAPVAASYPLGDSVKTIEWTEQGVRMIDQRLLPAQEEYRLCRTYQEVADAIRSMVIRGAPAIGVAAAMGVALGVRSLQPVSHHALREAFDRICDTLAHTRPTAVNLFWAIARMRARFEQSLAAGSALADIQEELAGEAQKIREEDLAANRAMGDCGAALLRDGQTVMTVCNAGALATAGYGTALGVIRSAIRAGKKLQVLALETRPFLQGARLTAWELHKEGIPTTLITDNMSGHFLRSGKVGCVLVGADRIAANGDVANKIGTYTVAVLAKENAVPFFVAAPLSTVDLSLPSGDDIPIEHRSEAEVTHVLGLPIAPAGVPALHPAFDVTPHRYVTAIVTERGIARPPFSESLRSLKQSA